MADRPVSQAYREGIRSAWQGEQWGKAFFERMAEAAEDAGRRAKWQVLAELEEATGYRLAPLVDDRTAVGLDEAVRSLEATVAANSELPWPEALRGRDARQKGVIQMRSRRAGFEIPADCRNLARRFVEVGEGPGAAA